MSMLLIVTHTKFPLGQIVITRKAMSTLSETAVNDGLRRHANGDWGSICPEDAQLNNDALIHGDRLMSVYGDGDERFWIITEWDRSITTVLMPEDY